MNDLFQEFQFTCAYIEDLLVFMQSGCTCHIQQLKLTQNKLKEGRFKYDIENYFFVKTKMGHLGLWMTCNVVRHLNKNI